MTDTPPDRAWYALIGDVVRSRAGADRRALHARVVEALTQVNAAVPARTALAVTIGDEFQGVYGTLGAALRASLLIRLRLLPQTDARFGIGRGSITPLDTDGLQDGPAWWAAREAVEQIEQAAARPATRELRTAYRAAPKAVVIDRDLQDAVNAALHCRDDLVGSMAQRSRRLLGGLMNGTPQRELAAAEGISPSAVSQRIRSDGLAVLVASEQLLAGLS